MTSSTSVRPKSSTSCFYPVLDAIAWLITSSRRLLLGNPAKAEKLLGWKRKVDFDSLVKEMVNEDLKASSNLIENQN